MKLAVKYLFINLLTILMLSLLLSACTPEIGSEQWCKKMESKSKGDWTTNEAADYAEHCVLKQFGLDAE